MHKAIGKKIDYFNKLNLIRNSLSLITVKKNSETKSNISKNICFKKQFLNTSIVTKQVKSLVPDMRKITHRIQDDHINVQRENDGYSDSTLDYKKSSRDNNLEKINDISIASIVYELFDNQARLPPSGTTMFDSRLTPAWPGLKMLY